MIISMVVTLVFIEPTKSQEINDKKPETWTSKDGRSVLGRGLYCGDKGITILATNGSNLLLPYALLEIQDAKRGIETLPFFINDDVRLSAKSIEMSKAVTEEETVDAITEVKSSGRNVEASLSSSTGDGHIALEFIVIAGSGKDKAIANRQEGVFEFSKLGSKVIFKGAKVANFNGWVVLARSLNTGKVVAISSSLKFLEKFVLEQVPEQAKIKGNDQRFKQYKQKLLKALK